jgi:hypothetical protein
MTGDMYNYLPTAVADYTAIELELRSQGSLTEKPVWNQATHRMDGGTIQAISYSDVVAYEVEMSFATLLPADSGLVMDIYSDPLKAMGAARTFYWHHPRDTYIYVVRFMSPMDRIISYLDSIRRVHFWVEGVKA